MLDASPQDDIEFLIQQRISYDIDLDKEADVREFVVYGVRFSLKKIKKKTKQSIRLKMSIDLVNSLYLTYF